MQDKNPGGVAFVWAHEFGHVALGHREISWQDRITTEAQRIEFEADDWARVAVRKLGWDPCDVLPIMKKYEMYERANRLAKLEGCENWTDFSSRNP